MGKARIGATALVILAAAATPGMPSFAAGQSRFVSYLSEGECTAGRVLPAAVCRSAFANARAEFESKTPAFPSMTQCARALGKCAPWPAGGKGRVLFRPQWSGVDIVDTPREKSVTPARVSGVKLTFAARPLAGPAAEPRELVVRGARPPVGFRLGSPVTGRTVFQRAAHSTAPERALGPSAPPLPGSGFKLQDGVLTYPAPARFAPKNLPRAP